MSKKGHGRKVSGSKGKPIAKEGAKDMAMDKAMAKGGAVKKCK